MLHIQDYLRAWRWEYAQRVLQSDLYGVDIRFHDDGRTLFKYNQFAANFNQPLVHECRGIILNRFDNWKVVSYPLDKFFFHNQERAARLDWHTVVGYEKLDGSLCTFYFWDGKWRIQTNKMIEANHVIDGTLNVNNHTFSDLCWIAFHKMGYLESNLDKTNSYMFELCSPLNKVITTYSDELLVLVAVRSVDMSETFFEDHIYEGYSWARKPKMHYPKSIEEAQEIADSFNDGEDGYEGLVLCDAYHKRVKIKNKVWNQKFYDRYQKMGSIAASHANMVQCIMEGDHPEFLEVYPDYEGVINDYIKKIDRFTLHIINLYNSLPKGLDRKEFAEVAKKTRYMNFMFGMYDGHVVSVKKYLRDLTIKRESGTFVLKLLQDFEKNQGA